MRFVLAIVSFVLALVLMGWGVAQQTVLAAPDEVQAAGETTGDAPVTVIDSSALNAFEGTQTLEVNGDDVVFAAYGRTNDVLSWIGDTEYNLVTYDVETGVARERARAGRGHRGAGSRSAPTCGSPRSRRTSSLRLKLNAPEGVSVIIASDGVLPAPSTLSLTWPLDNSTPWAIPVIIAGAAVLLLGLIFLLWAIHGVRSSRGPRRKQPKLPRQPRYKPGRKGRTPAKVGTAVAPVGGGRRAARPLIAVPVVLVGALALSGCTCDSSRSPVPPSRCPDPRHRPSPTRSRRPPSPRTRSIASCRTSSTSPPRRTRRRMPRCSPPASTDRPSPCAPPTTPCAPTTRRSPRSCR